MGSEQGGCFDCKNFDKKIFKCKVNNDFMSYLLGKRKSVFDIAKECKDYEEKGHE